MRDPRYHRLQLPHRLVPCTHERLFSGGVDVRPALVFCLQRNLDDERERLRSRSEQATAKQHERQAVLLDGGAKRPTPKTARPTPNHRACHPDVHDCEQFERSCEGVTASALEPEHSTVPTRVRVASSTEGTTNVS